MGLDQVLSASLSNKSWTFSFSFSHSPLGVLNFPKSRLRGSRDQCELPVQFAESEWRLIMFTKWAGHRVRLALKLWNMTRFLSYVSSHPLLPSLCSGRWERRRGWWRAQMRENTILMATYLCSAVQQWFKFEIWIFFFLLFYYYF